MKERLKGKNDTEGPEDHPILHCIFCRKSQRDAQRIIASSPSIAICDECVSLFSMLLAGRSDSQTAGQYEILSDQGAHSPEGFWLWRRIRDSSRKTLCCVFCHRRQADVDRMIGKTPQYVCDECVSAMVNLLEEENVENGNSGPASI